MWPWLGGLVALIVVTVAAATVMSWIAADLQQQANDFYTSQDGSAQIADEVYQHWDAISQTAYTLQQLVPPVLLGCSASVFALLAVLARRWDVARRRSLAAS
ncbi:hypothetical protein BH09ACT4_BH09ACT4_10440 [soil metagenome]